MMQSSHSGAGKRSFGEGWMEIEVAFITDELDRGYTSTYTRPACEIRKSGPYYF